MKLDSHSLITAGALTVDPTLGPINRVEFLQVVGLTADELELCRSWRTDAMLDLARRANPLLVTDLERASLLDDPALREEAEAGVAADGSSLAELRVASLRWKLPVLRGRGPRRTRLVVTMGAGAATALGPALRRRLSREGASFVVGGDEGEVHFEVVSAAGSGSAGPGSAGLAGAGAAWRLIDDVLTVQVPLAEVDHLAGLFTGRTGAGSLPGLSDLRFAVVA